MDLQKSIIHSIIALLVLALLSGGCTAINRSTSPPSGTIAEINAAAKLSFDNDKAARLSSIAKRKHLEPAAQVYLVNTTLKHVSFSNYKESILLTLINNPNFCLKAKDTILNKISRISFSNYQRSILDAIDKHGPCIDEYPNEPTPAPPLKNTPAEKTK